MHVARTMRLAIAAFAVVQAACLCATAQEAKPSARVLLDRVVAVVNNRAILASDVEREMRLSVIEPRRSNETPDPRSALDRLVSRSLIQQQMGQEEAAVAPNDDEVQARIAEIRKQLPACAGAHCESEEGWHSFLSTNRLTTGEVERYMRLRLEFLGFIEDRFQSGIRISQEEIEAYYKTTFLPQYPKDQKAPSLESVSKSIEEILLQEQVNKLFSAWLDNLRKQGDVQILDPALELPDGQAANGGGGA
jgi:peptidyl-prolyl cis-trans isomerase SurA